MTFPGREILAGEARAGTELGRLLIDPVFYGVGVPHGDGRPVLCLPGLFGNDLYLGPLHTWLARIGYRPVISTIAFNAGCPDRIRAQASEALAPALGRGRPIAIIGHSRGGMLGWAIAVQLGVRVSHLALLGSPAGSVSAMLRRGGWRMSAAPAAARVVQAADLARRVLTPTCEFPACECAYVAALRSSPGPGTRVLSVYSPEDAIVPPETCPVPGAENIEVRGSHAGLANNVLVYRALARFLGS
jgi:pimeloyl-ACP methyl ester carboxylesterase